METGLYGQNERGAYFSTRALENRIGDVQSEGTGYAVPTQDEYRQMMANVYIKEIEAAKAEQQMIAWYDEQRAKNRNNFIVAEVIMRSFCTTTEQQTAALKELGDLFDRMLADGFALPIVQDTVTQAFPVALNRLRETYMKRHPGVDKKKIRLRATATPYNATVIEKFGEKANPKLMDIFASK